MTPDTLILYHADCPDGFGAAYAAWLALGEQASYVPCKYGNAPPEVGGKRVYVLDFSFSQEVLLSMAAQAASVTLIDHHKTAQEDLLGLDARENLHIHFDMAKSGAMLAWEHFHPGTKPPVMFEWIEDRDLWRWKIDGSREFLAALDGLPKSFDAWQQFAEVSETPEGVKEIFKQGRIIDRKLGQMCAEIASKAFEITLCGHKTLAVTAPSELASDVGALLAIRTGTLGVVFRQSDAKTVSVSLRSVPGFDASVIAKQFDGGGHAQSCAFRVDLARWAQLMSESTVNQPES